MQPPQTHIVSRYAIELDFQDRDDAAAISDAVLAECRKAVGAIIDDCCSAYVQAHEYVTIPQLEIDLGELDPRHVTTDFLQKFKTGLAVQLQRAINAQEVPSPETRAAELLRHFGETGQYPWWAGSPAPELLDEAVASLIHAQAKLSSHFWEQLLGQGQTLRRLVFSLPDTLLIALYEALGRHQAPRLAQATLEAATRVVFARHRSLPRSQWLAFAFQALSQRLRPQGSTISPQQLWLWLLSEGRAELPTALRARFAQVDAWLTILAWMQEVLAAPAEVVADHVLELYLTAGGAEKKQATAAASAENAMGAWLRREWHWNDAEIRDFLGGFAIAYQLNARKPPHYAAADLLAAFEAGHPSWTTMTLESLTDWLGRRDADLSAHQRDAWAQKILVLAQAQKPALAAVNDLWVGFQTEHPLLVPTLENLGEWLGRNHAALPLARRVELAQAMLAQAPAQVSHIPTASALWADFQVAHPTVMPTLERLEEWLAHQHTNLPATQRLELAKAILALGQTQVLQTPSAAVLWADFRALHPTVVPTLERLGEWLAHQHTNLPAAQRLELAKAILALGQAQVLQMPSVPILWADFRALHPTVVPTLERLGEWLTQHHADLPATQRLQLSKAMLELGHAQAPNTPAAPTLWADFQAAHPTVTPTLENIREWLAQHHAELPAAQHLELAQAMLTRAPAPLSILHKPSTKARTDEISVFLAEFEAARPNVAPSLGALQQWLAQAHKLLPTAERTRLAQAMLARLREKTSPSHTAADLLAQYEAAHPRTARNISALEAWLSQAHPTLTLAARQAWVQEILALPTGPIRSEERIETPVQPSPEQPERDLLERDLPERDQLERNLPGHDQLERDLPRQNLPEHDLPPTSEAERAAKVHAVLQEFQERHPDWVPTADRVADWLAYHHPALHSIQRRALAAEVLEVYIAQLPAENTHPDSPQSFFQRFQATHPDAVVDRQVLVDWVKQQLGIAADAQNQLVDAMVIVAAQVAAAAAKPQQSLQALAQPRRPSSSNDAPLWVDNAGLVLFWPFFQRFFQQLGLVEDKTFVSMMAREQAIHLLQLMIMPEGGWNEAALALPKLLCGLSPDAVIDPQAALSAEQREASAVLIEVTLAHWTLAGSMSADGFRHAWLQRYGTLRIRDDHWLLRVETMGHDMLLEGLPWEIAYVQLPWMPHVMYVDWGEKAKFNA